MEQTVKKQLKAAKEAWANGDAEALFRHARTALDYDENNYMGLVYLGMAEQMRGNVPEAESAFQRAIALQLDTPTAYQGLQKLYEGIEPRTVDSRAKLLRTLSNLRVLASKKTGDEADRRLATYSLAELEVLAEDGESSERVLAKSRELLPGGGPTADRIAGVLEPAAVARLWTLLLDAQRKITAAAVAETVRTQRHRLGADPVAVIERRALEESVADGARRRDLERALAAPVWTVEEAQKLRHELVLALHGMCLAASGNAKAPLRDALWRAARDQVAGGSPISAVAALLSDLLDTPSGSDGALIPKTNVKKALEKGVALLPDDAATRQCLVAAAGERFTGGDSLAGSVPPEVALVPPVAQAARALEVAPSLPHADALLAAAATAERDYGLYLETTCLAAHRVRVKALGASHGTAAALMASCRYVLDRDEHDATARVALGELEIELRHFEAAEAAFGGILEDCASELRARADAGLGWSRFLGSGASLDAWRSLSRALDAGRRDSTTLSRAAQVLWALRENLADFSEAVPQGGALIRELLDGAVAAAAPSAPPPGTFGLLGIVAYELDGDRDAAKRAFKRELPAHLSVRAGQSYCRLLLADGDLRGVSALCTLMSIGAHPQPWALRQLAIVHISENRHDVAVHLLQKLIRQSQAVETRSPTPAAVGDPHALELLGECYLCTGKFAAARLVLEEACALSDDPARSRSVRYLLLVLYHRLGRHADAERVFEQLEAARGKEPLPAAVLLARTAQLRRAALDAERDGAYGVAVDRARNAIATLATVEAPERLRHSPLKWLGDLLTVLARHRVQADRSSLPKELFESTSPFGGLELAPLPTTAPEKATRALAVRAYAAAVARAQADRLGNVPASWYWHDLGVACLHAGDKAAIVALQLALRLQPGEAWFWTTLGTALAQTDSARAVHCLCTAVTLKPRLAPAWCALGYVYLKSGEIARARRAFGQAEAANPTHIDCWYGLALAELASGNLADARERLEHAMDLVSESAASKLRHRQLFVTFAEQLFCPSGGQVAPETSQVLFALFKALEHDPRDAAAQNLLGLVLESHGGTEANAAAAAAFERSLELQELPAVRANLVRALCAAGSVDRAAAAGAATVADSLVGPPRWLALLVAALVAYFAGNLRPALEQLRALRSELEAVENPAAAGMRRHVLVFASQVVFALEESGFVTATDRSGSQCRRQLVQLLDAFGASNESVSDADDGKSTVVGAAAAWSAMYDDEDLWKTAVGVCGTLRSAALDLAQEAAGWARPTAVDTVDDNAAIRSDSEEPQPEAEPKAEVDESLVKASMRHLRCGNVAKAFLEAQRAVHLAQVEKDESWLALALTVRARIDRHPKSQSTLLKLLVFAEQQCGSRTLPRLWARVMLAESLLATAPERAQALAADLVRHIQAAQQQGGPLAPPASLLAAATGVLQASGRTGSPLDTRIALQKRAVALEESDAANWHRLAALEMAGGRAAAAAVVLDAAAARAETPSDRLWALCDRARVPSGDPLAAVHSALAITRNAPDDPAVAAWQPVVRLVQALVLARSPDSGNDSRACRLLDGGPSESLLTRAVALAARAVLAPSSDVEVAG